MSSAPGVLRVILFPGGSLTLADTPRRLFALRGLGACRLIEFTNKTIDDQATAFLHKFLVDFEGGFDIVLDQAEVWRTHATCLIHTQPADPRRSHAGFA